MKWKILSEKTESNHTPTGQSEIVKALMDPQMYDEVVDDVSLVQTHISFVFLAGDFVYKMKKAVNFGFLDFTTLEKRKYYCEKEVELNRRLCGDMYIGVVTINRSNNIKIKGEGEVVEYVVKMRRIPEKHMMNKLLDQGEVNEELIDKIADIIARFHSRAETNERISSFGSIDVIESNWEENFEQTREFIKRTISSREFKQLRDKTISFIAQHRQLFNQRVRNKRIRDCHGDIHTSNIFLSDRIYIFDAIEFNERFRYSDVTADLAFLAMDLDFKGRSDLSTLLVERYKLYSGDRALSELLPFYKCYRAYVRGKVTSFMLNDSNIDSNKRSGIVQVAKRYFKLALTYI